MYTHAHTYKHTYIHTYTYTRTHIHVNEHTHKSRDTYISISISHSISALGIFGITRIFPSFVFSLGTNRLQEPIRLATTSSDQELAQSPGDPLANNPLASQLASRTKIRVTNSLRVCGGPL